MRHLDSWIKIDQLDVTCFIISLFTAQHVSDVNTSILRSLRLIWWVISWVVLFCKDRGFALAYLFSDECLVVTCAVVWERNTLCKTTAHVTTKHSSLNKYANANPLSLQNNTTHEITHQISRKFLRVDVLTFETCWAVNNEIIKQVTSSWSIFIQQ